MMILMFLLPLSGLTFFWNVLPENSYKLEFGHLVLRGFSTLAVQSSTRKKDSSVQLRYGAWKYFVNYFSSLIAFSSRFCKMFISPIHFMLLTNIHVTFLYITIFLPLVVALGYQSAVILISSLIPKGMQF